MTLNELFAIHEADVTEEFLLKAGRSEIAEESAEIFLRIGRCVHYGITDVCAVNREPPDAIGVFRDESLYIAFCRRLLGRLCFSLCRRDRRLGDL